MMAPSTLEEPPMNKPISPSTGTGLRQRLIEDMSVHGLTEKTRRDYICSVAGFASFLSRSPDTATAEDIRRFQIHLSELGMHAPAMNSTVSALRFFFTYRLDRPDISRKLIRLRYARKLPTVLSADEVARLLAAAKSLMHLLVTEMI
jgi:integrase/recombinase XerD